MTDFELKEYERLKKKDTAIPIRETTSRYFCPVCSRMLGGKQSRHFIYGRMYYCPRCGQHLDTRKLKD